jgi:putative flippase GtrA
MKSFAAWLKQPTTILGLSGLLTTLSAVLDHQITIANAVPFIVGSAVSMLLPDNSTVKNDAESLAQALLRVAAGNAAAAPAAIQDVAALANDLTKNAQAPTGSAVPPGASGT